MNTRKQWKENFGWVTVPDHREWDPPNLREWVDKATELYPPIVRVLLIGSRGGEQGKMVKDDSDFDVVILLDSSCYTEDIDGYLMTDLEQALTFDNRLKCHGLDVLASGEHDLDIYFLRPDGLIGAWNFPQGKEVPPIWYFELISQQPDPRRKRVFEKGLPYWADCRPFYKALPTAPTLFDRQGHNLDPIRKQLLREPLRAPCKLHF